MTSWLVDFCDNQLGLTYKFSSYEHNSSNYLSMLTWEHAGATINFKVVSMFLTPLTMAAQLGCVVSCIFSVLVAIVSITFTFLKHKKSYKKSKKLPPGQMGLPWIGETMEFYKAQRKNQLFEELVRPRITKYGKIFKTTLMGSPTVVVNGADANRFFLSNEFKLVISSWPFRRFSSWARTLSWKNKERGTGAFAGL